MIQEQFQLIQKPFSDQIKSGKKPFPFVEGSTLDSIIKKEKAKLNKLDFEEALTNMRLK